MARKFCGGKGILEIVKGYLNKRLWKHLTLGHIFARPKDPVKTNQKPHAVYSIPCGDCEKEYLGQSKRQFGTRLKEHQKAVSTLDNGKSDSFSRTCVLHQTIDCVGKL